ncbi:MAG: transcription-repair coupling factor [Oscillospiraceae bacterium]
MKEFYKILQADSSFRQLERGLAKGDTPQLMVGLPNVHKAHTIYSLCMAIGAPALVLTADEPTAVRLCEDLNTLLGFEGAVFFPSRELTFREVEGVSLEYEHARLGVFERMLGGTAPIVVSGVEAAVQYTIPESELRRHTAALRPGEAHNLDELLELLVSAGYVRSEQVEGVSQFAVRGGILDFMPPGVPNPFRVEFWGDEVDTVSTFDLATQRRLEEVPLARITPAREALVMDSSALAKKLEAVKKSLRGKYGALAKEHIDTDVEKLSSGASLVSADRFLPLLYDRPHTLFDYCRDRLFFALEPVSMREGLKNASWQMNEDIKILLSEGILFKGIDRFSLDFADVAKEIQEGRTAVLDTFARTLPEVSFRGMHQVNAVQLSVWGGDYQLLLEDLQDYMARGYAAAVLAGTKRAGQALLDDLNRDKVPAALAEDLDGIHPGTVTILEGSLSAGMEYPDLKFALITHAKTSAPVAHKKRRHKEGKKLRNVSDLTVGDYVVHSSHGIGVFEGIVKRDMHGVVKDYIKIRYAGTDALFVPVTQLDLVSKYIGAAENANVRLNRLNSVEWQKTRARVKGAVREMAKELIALYAKRQNTPGFAFSPDGDWQQEFEERFPYEETDDQLRSAQEIKADMEKSMPMDRLLCGDVGFGKTEVALRAVFKCVLDGKQCAVLVPTTILAWQHYQTFLRRMEGYPITVELLSRFRSKKEQAETVKKLTKGQVDVVIGTHRVVQKDVQFKDLGLVVIDEEQRFGVAHKERFKELRTNVDILTLSATPIPRTLNMAMSGIRDMSLIEEAPQDRYPVQTYVLEYDQGIIIQAIQKELRRGGQVFYLHNRVDSIDSCAARLKKQLPDARIVTAHGKMGEEALSDIWQALVEHEVDILVCTTIIETGVDVPNANTLIIEDADNYGLSQLYQLRGRVGRSPRRAYAYLTFRGGKALTDIATKRLSAIREFTTFGSGFRIAMRDLEIRGAGNILGAQQHGHMEAVGYDLYLRLLAEAVSEETGESVRPPTECIIDVRVDAYLPEDYIGNLSQRIDIYKKIASVETGEDALDIIDELIDRFGEPPQSVKGLVDVALVRGRASRLGITEITQSGERILLYPEQLDMHMAGAVASKMQGRVMVNAGMRPYFSVKQNPGQGPVDTIRETLELMGGEPKANTTQ